MSWFQLDPQSIASRAQGFRAPSLSASLWRGLIGFTLVSIAGFLPWGVFGNIVRSHIGELGMYVVCAAVFLLLFRGMLGRGFSLKTKGPNMGAVVRSFTVFTLALGIALAWGSLFR